MSYYDYIHTYSWDDIKQEILDKSSNDVINAVNNPHRTMDDFMALISPNAAPFLEEMAVEANRLSLERFGNVMQMYIPLYVSNYCQNACVYCGFNHTNKIKRKLLTMDEIDREVEAILKLGYKHILLVSGEAPAFTGVDYYNQVIQRLRPHFSQISLEVQPLEVAEYSLLKESGLGFVCVYQETYHEKAYPDYHPKGKKADYRYRLETPDRIGQADIPKIGIGALLGLEDWRTDSFFTALHLKYLEKTYWRTKYSISLPRLRPHAGSFMPKDPISDKQLVQLICAYRLLDKDIDISLSTRESSKFRDHVMRLGITSVSAGSSTEPGGYVEKHKELEQFAINDERSPEEMAAAIRTLGYEPVWKDWDSWM